jgi:hypothetical protein
MSATLVRLAVVLSAVALAACAGHRPIEEFDHEPGGPIVVIQPDPDGRPTASVECKNFPCWYIDCPEGTSAKGLPSLAKANESVNGGIPWRLGSPLGAERISVTLKNVDSHFPKNPIDASEFQLELDATRTLRVRLPEKNRLPSWTLQKGTGAENELKAKRLVYLPNWPHELLGKITSARVASRKQPNDLFPVDITNIKSIKVFYNRDYAYCE